MPPRRETAHLLASALRQAAGDALVLDADLHIVAGTPGVEAVLGDAVPLGERAPQVLCGKGQRRPIAEALARGESASAEIRALSPDREGVIGVRTVPLESGGAILGHLLFLTPRTSSSGEITESHGIVTASESMRSLLRQVARVAASDVSVLLRGETGSGKELVSRALHELSPRRDKPFLALNCAALPPDLLESELFGHVRGAFTGAVKDNIGHFRKADGGTLFLDEVAELPLAVQAKLLRVTQEKTVLPIGGTTPIPVDVRLVSATHRSLRQEVAEGRFRPDLMFRLRVIPLYLPPLRERPADVTLLIDRIIGQLNSRSTSRHVERVSPGAMDVLLHHSWPGNVRELQNVMQYAFLLGDGPVLTEGELPRDLREEDAPPAARGLAGLAAGGAPPEARRIARALERAGGNRGRAATILGVSRATLWRKIKKFQIDAFPLHG